jgi:hypothetical protein
VPRIRSTPISSFPHHGITPGLPSWLCRQSTNSFQIVLYLKTKLRSPLPEAWVLQSITHPISRFRRVSSRPTKLPNVICELLMGIGVTHAYTQLDVAWWTVEADDSFERYSQTSIWGLIGPRNRRSRQLSSSKMWYIAKLSKAPLSGAPLSFTDNILSLHVFEIIELNDPVPAGTVFGKFGRIIIIPEFPPSPELARFRNSTVRNTCAQLRSCLFKVLEQRRDTRYELWRSIAIHQND